MKSADRTSGAQLPLQPRFEARHAGLFLDFGPGEQLVLAPRQGEVEVAESPLRFFPRSTPSRSSASRMVRDSEEHTSVAPCWSQ